MARRKGRNFWNAMQQGLPMGFQAGMQNLRSREYAEEREKDREAREREDYMSRQERGRVRTQAAQQRETESTRGNQAVQRLIDMEYGEGASGEFTEGAPWRMRAPSTIGGGISQDLSGIGAFGDVLGRRRDREAKEHETTLVAARDRADDDAFQKSNRQAFDRLMVLSEQHPSLSKYKGASYNVNSDYIAELGRFTPKPPDTSAEDEAITMEGEKAAHAELQRIYSEEYGQQPFNLASAQRGHYSQSLKELSVAEARPESGAGSLLAWIMSGSQGPPPSTGGGGGIGGQGPPVIDSPLSKSELTGALALIDDLQTWAEKEQELVTSGFYGPNQIAQIKAKVGG